MIPDEIVERVRSSADIVQIISEYVPLKRAGADYRGPCPFHQGTKPNFSVSPKRGSYHCFVCHESGDVFSFVRKRLGLDWPAAVKLIGERVGIEVVDTPRYAHVADPNERNWEVLATAAEWFRQQLVDDAVGRDARAYLDKRGLDIEARERFGIGFAPRDAQAVRRHLHTLGFDDERQLEAGLLVQREGEAELRSRFRGRVMFPILDEFTHHVGFGGRALGDDTPKYLNSPESQVFQKRRVLYGLVTARNAMRRAQRAIVVEGYMDAIRLTLAGFEEVVAPLGTALTEEQAQLLTKYTRDVYLLYDSDEAGLKATFRSGLELLRQRAVVRVVTLPDGEDPDTFIRNRGAPAMQEHLQQAIDLFDRQVQLLERRGWFTDIGRRRRAVDRLLPTIRAAREPLTRDMYLARLSEATGIDKAALVSEADEPPTRVARRDEGSSNAATSDNVVSSEQPAPPEHHQNTFVPRQQWKRRPRRGDPPEWMTTPALPPVASLDDPVERALVKAMIAERPLVERIAERYAPDDFRDARYRTIFATLLDDPEADVEAVANRLPEQALAVWRTLVNGADNNTAVGADIELMLAKFEARRIDERIQAILREMGSAPAEAQSALMRERIELEGELRQLVPVRSPRRPSRRKS